MLKKLIFGLLFLLFMFSVFGETISFTDDLVGLELPGFSKNFFKDDLININLALSNGETMTLGITLENGKVVSVVPNLLTNPNLEVNFENGVIEDITNSGNPFKKFKNSLEEDKITYKAFGFKNKLKYKMLMVMLSVSSLFDNVGDNNPVDSRNDNSYKINDNQLETKDTSEPIEKNNKNKSDMSDGKESNDNQKSSNDKFLATKTDKEITDKETDEIISSNVFEVEVKKEGFEPSELIIKVGDTIQWQVTRDGNLDKAIIMGTKNCVKVRSKILKTGDVFSWKFTEPGKCDIVDGITTTQLLKVKIE